MTTIKGYDFGLETVAGIKFDIDVRADASVTIERDGQSIDQRIVPVQDIHLRVGQRLFHRVDRQIYSITKIEPESVHLQGPTGESDGTPQQIKSVFWSIVESPG